MKFEYMLIFCSVAFFIWGIGYYLARARKRSLSRRLLMLNGALLASVFFLELFYRLYGGEPVKLSLLLINSMKALKMTADYAAVTSLQPVFGVALYDGLLCMFRTTVYTLAPITGFTLIYDVVAGVSPSLKLFIHRRQAMFVFSRLNEGSLYLAQDIADQKQLGRPLLIFTDCGRAEAQLRTKARAMGALCLEDELTRHDSFRAARQCCFFLTDRDDAENLSLLRAMLNMGKSLWPAKKGCSIFFFTNSADTVESLRSMKREYRARKGEEENGRLRIHTVRDYAQSAVRLLDTQPLYGVLEGPETGEGLKVLVLGYNGFAQEMVKSLFWCGQMPGQTLKLCLAAPENAGGENEYEGWLRRLNPEIMESCTEGAACLRYSGDGFGEPYAALSFVSADMQSLDVHSFLGEKRRYACGSDEEFSLEDYNCFFVMGGDDALNMRLAEQLRRELAYRQQGRRKKYIYCLIENEDLKHAGTVRYDELRAGAAAVELFAFGSLSERYSWANVSMNSAWLSGETQAPGLRQLHSLPGVDQSGDDIYNEWSNAARRVHLGCKLFIAGFGLVPPEQRQALMEEYRGRAKEDRELYFKLTWLEHRRWNAFLRMEGFRTPPGLRETLEGGKLTELEGEKLRMYSYKNIPDRLHPCLVESAPGAEAGPDWLDTVSEIRDMADRAHGKAQSADERGGLSRLKVYDTPGWE